MPFPLELPTTSSCSFVEHFESPSHPSLPLTATTHRSVLRAALKAHKRLASPAQSSNLTNLHLTLTAYLPYLLALDAGLASSSVANDEIDVILTSNPSFSWRPTLTASPIPSRPPPRVTLTSIEYDILFTISTLAYTHTLLARHSLHPLYSTTSTLPSGPQRTLAINTARNHLLTAASIHTYLSTRTASLSSPPPCTDISTPTFLALAALAEAEATILFVHKDDPYPAAVAQDRNKTDREWMIKAPDMPRVRAHLFARLCLGAWEHASKASALLAQGGAASVDGELVRYVRDLKSTAKAKACRFLGIDADLAGQGGAAIAWLRGGMEELGMGGEVEKKGKGAVGKWKREWSERREEKRVEGGKGWGADAGRAEEGRVLVMLHEKWVKMNDTINSQPIPPSASLLSTLPSGREAHTVPVYTPPALDAETLQAMRAAPDRSDAAGAVDDDSSDEEAAGKKGGTVIGAFPGSKAEYAGSGRYY